MPYNTTTGVFTRTSNTFSDPVAGTVIDPDDAILLFDDYDTSGLTLAFGQFGTIAETSLAIGATPNVGATATFRVLLTGSAATITSFGTVANRIRTVRFDGVNTLTHNATTLILPGAVNIITATGDVGIFLSSATGNWRCIMYTNGNGVFSGTGINVSGNILGPNEFLTGYVDQAEIASPASPSADHLRLFAKDVGGVTHYFQRDSAGTEVDLTLGGSGVSAASQAQMEAASSTAVFVSPGRQQFHPSAAKGWCRADAAGSAQLSYNVTSVTDDGTGLATITWDIDSSGNYTAVATAFHATTALIATIGSHSSTANQIRVYDTAGVLADPTLFEIAAFGDQA